MSVVPLVCGRLMKQRPGHGVSLVTTRVREVDGRTGVAGATRATSGTLTLVCSHSYTDVTVRMRS